MINHQIKLTKDKLNKDNNTDILKLELLGGKIKEQTHKRQPLNISLVIDCSGSMASGVNGHMSHLALMNQIGNLETPEKSVNNVSKIDMAKKSALSFIDTLEDNDFISIVVFGDESTVTLPATKMTKENKEKAKNTVEKEVLPNKGMTNLYGGWIDGVKEVTNNIQKEALNRVIVITDGQLNRGETNNNTIKEAVLKMYDASVSTSTFGVGEDFNEDLLQAMAFSGGGNSYYINNNHSFTEFVNEEISGIINVVAKNIKVSVEFNKNFKNSELVNDGFEKNKDGAYIVPSMRSEQKLSLIFDLKYGKVDSKKSVKAGTLVLQYTDENNEEIYIKNDLKLSVCNEEDWKKLKEHKDVIIEKNLMDISNIKEKAKVFMDQGDFSKAKNVLGHISDSKLSTYDKELYKKECDKMDGLLRSMDNGESFGAIRKNISYQSYYTRTGRD